MRRFFSTAASAALVLTLAACGSPPEDPAAESSAPAASPTSEPAATAPAIPVETPESAATAAAPAAAVAGATAAAPAATVAAAPAAPPAAFMQCRACHSVEPGRHGIGPSLHGIYGTKAGDIPGYAVSGPLKASGLTWDDATLDTWLQGSSKMVPGTRMVFAGMPDAARRKAVIDYMKTLK